MSELYSRTDEELEQGLREVEIVGVGFEIPTYSYYVAPNAPKFSANRKLKLQRNNR